MNAKPYVLMTVHLPAQASTVEAAARWLGVDPTSIDPDFGVVSVDPASNRFALMLDARFVSGALEREGVDGPFANPRIEPFDLPEA